MVLMALSQYWDACIRQVLKENICVKGKLGIRETDRERTETQRERVHTSVRLLVYSPKWLQYMEPDQLKARTQSFFQVSHVGTAAHVLGPSSASFPDTLEGS